MYPRSLWRIVLYSLLAISLVHTYLDVGAISGTSILGADDPETFLFIDDILSAYQLQQPNISFVMQTGTATINENLLFTNSVDFAIISSVLTPEQQETHPTVLSLPFIGTAIVPIYRLDSLGSSAPAVVFSRSVLAQIYTGNITSWNDPQIIHLNAGVSMPNQPITLVLDISSLNLNQVFTDALCHFEITLCTQIPVSTQPLWPVLNYSKYLTTVGPVAVAASVTTTDNSLGYTTLPIALNTFATVGSMVNKAGYLVQPGSSSTSFALVELATQAVDHGDNINDPSGASAWPINIMSYLLIDTQYTRDTCTVREEVVEFWLFVYQSTIAGKLAQTRKYALLPDLLMTVFEIINTLQTQILCQGQQVVTTTSVLSIVIGGTERLSFLSNMLVDVYSGSGITDYTYLPLTSQVAWDKLDNQEIDVAIVYQDELSPSTLEEIQSSSEYLLIPAFLNSITPIYNPEILPGVMVDSLIVDVGTFFRILLFNITDWKDPAILKYNPTLASQLGNQATPITLIDGCASTHAVNELIYWAAAYAAAFDPSLLTIIAEALGNAALLSAFETCISDPEHSVIFSPNEDALGSIVSTVIGSAGYTQDRGGSNTKFALMYPRMVDGTLQYVSIASNTETMLACVEDTFSQTTLAVNPHNSQNPNCWPFTTVAYVAVRTSYSSDAIDTSACTQGLPALQLVQWLITNPLLAGITVSLMSPRPSHLSAVQTAIVAALDAVTCDGSTMLITLPVIWSLAPGANVFGIFMAALGLIGILIALGFVIKYWTSSVIRSSSPMFLCTSLLGVGLMLISVVFWVSTATRSNCNGFSWCINLGFMLTFAPLFAKTWRVYRIFGRKKLSVIKINNRKLGLMVMVFILGEIIILSIWQGVSPLQPVLTTQITGSPGTVHDYTQCGILPGGSTFLGLIGVTKGGMLLYGALLAFSTRRVSEKFNESQTIAWAIYNVVFSGGIIAIIIALLGPVGDVLVILVLLLIVWIAYFTALVIIIPKMMGVWSPANGLNAAELSGTKSSIGGFSFLSVAEMAEPVLLMQYQSALTEQLKQVTHKLEVLKADKGGVKRVEPVLQLARSPSITKTLEKKGGIQQPTRGSMDSRVIGGKSKQVVAAPAGASHVRLPSTNNRNMESRSIENRSVEHSESQIDPIEAVSPKKESGETKSLVETNSSTSLPGQTGA
jgi:phosphate transport system substrate-binding protein